MLNHLSEAPRIALPPATVTSPLTMELPHLDSLWPVARTLFYLWISTILYSKAKTWLHNRSVARKTGSQDPPKYPHKDLIFGLDLFLLYVKAFQARKFLDLNWDLFAKHGKTFDTHKLGVRIIKTMDPNLTKYVHATYFDNFGVERIRSGIEYLWGDGITVVDGEKWAARRKLIKPAFDVAHIANLENRSLSRHVDRLMRLVPRDGSTVDLMPLFRRLVSLQNHHLSYPPSLTHTSMIQVPRHSQRVHIRPVHGRPQLPRLPQRLPRSIFLRPTRNSHPSRARLQAPLPPPRSKMVARLRHSQRLPRQTRRRGAGTTRKEPPLRYSPSDRRNGQINSKPPHPPLPNAKRLYPCPRRRVDSTE